MTQPAVFLDRDGTLIEERGYIDRLDLLTCFPWTARRAAAAEPRRLCHRRHHQPVGHRPRHHRRAVSRRGAPRARRRLAPAGARIDRLLLLPALRGCAHRALPAWRAGAGSPGRADRAGVPDMGLDPRGRSWSATAGATSRAAQAAGDAHGPRAHRPRRCTKRTPPDGVRPDAILNNLMEAVGWILRIPLPRRRDDAWVRSCRASDCWSVARRARASGQSIALAAGCFDPSTWVTCGISRRRRARPTCWWWRSRRTSDARLLGAAGRSWRAEHRADLVAALRCVDAVDAARRAVRRVPDRCIAAGRLLPGR